MQDGGPRPWTPATQRAVLTGRVRGGGASEPGEGKRTRTGPRDPSNQSEPLPGDAHPCVIMRDATDFASLLN